MEQGYNPFKKAGLVLLVLGVIDILLMIYFISNKGNYSSSLNIFAVIGGILLIRGSIKSARIIRFFSAFLAVTFLGMFLILPLITPLSLLLVQIKLNPLFTVGTYLISTLFTSVIIWVYFQLSNPDSLAALERAGYKTKKPIVAFLAGFVVLITVPIFTMTLLNSDSATKAKEIAQEKFGNEYSYHVRSISISGDHGIANVTAYTTDKIEQIDVKW